MKNLPDFFRRGSLGLSEYPYQDLLSLRDQMDRLFNDLWKGEPVGLANAVKSTPGFAPSCEVSEADSHYLLSFDLPGVKKEDIRVSLENGTLTVTGERKDECEQKGRNHYHSEKFYGVFSRSFELPGGIKPEQVEASYSDGVLRLTVPKTETPKAQQIKISEGKPGLWEKLVGSKRNEPQQQSEKRAAEKVA